MEASSDNPRVSDVLEVLSERVPGGARCPICKERVWKIVDDLITNVGLREVRTESDADEGPAVEPASILTVTLICSNCAFLRQHAVSDF